MHLNNFVKVNKISNVYKIKIALNTYLKIFRSKHTLTNECLIKIVCNLIFLKSLMLVDTLRKIVRTSY